MDKKTMLEALISHFTNGNKAQFAKLLGVSPQTISAWIARNTFDSELIYAKCRYINPSWLLTGQGNMLTNDENTQNVKSSREAIPAIDGMPNDIKPIPLV
ncbi:helix-turn-helix domain-containing protein, partial [Prevotella copri]